MLILKNGSTALSEVTRLFAGTDEESDIGVDVLDRAVLTVPQSRDELVVSLGLLQFLSRTGGLPDEGRAEMVGWAVDLYRRARSSGEIIRPQDLATLRRLMQISERYDWHVHTHAKTLLDSQKPRLVP